MGKRNGLKLSSDPLNVLAVHSYKSNGLTQEEAVGLSGSQNGIILSTKVTKNNSKPSKNVRKAKLSGGNRKIIKAIEKKLSGNYYRSDLKDAAIRKACAL